VCETLIYENPVLGTDDLSAVEVSLFAATHTILSRRCTRTRIQKVDDPRYRYASPSLTMLKRRLGQDWASDEISSSKYMVGGSSAYVIVLW
jgi:hypothetical protein